MPKRDTDLLIGDMLESSFLIFEYTKGMHYTDFIADRKTVDAVIRNFEVLGEAAKRIPEGLQLANPHIDWRRISDFRNLLIHEYFGINYTIVWKIIEEYLPDVYKHLNDLSSQ
jgi:uncharacterized protein with HEPN domain